MPSNPEDLVNEVEIVEPPIQELKKRGRWMTTACFSGCGCVALFIIGVIFGIKLFIGAGPKQAKNLPADFPAEIPVYDKYNVGKITLISGRYKYRSLELAALFPKIVLSSLVISESGGKKNGQSVIQELWRALTKPVSDNRGMVQIEWYGIASEPEAMIEYYQSKLKEAGFVIDSETQSSKYRQFTFRRDNGLSGTVYVESDEKNKNIPYAFIIVNLALPETAPAATSTSALKTDGQDSNF
jgi:hypothetical protein